MERRVGNGSWFGWHFVRGQRASTVGMQGRGCAGQMGVCKVEECEDRGVQDGI